MIDILQIIFEFSNFKMQLKVIRLSHETNKKIKIFKSGYHDNKLTNTILSIYYTPI